MELVVGIAIGILSTIFLGSLITALVVCRQRYCSGSGRRGARGHMPRLLHVKHGCMAEDEKDSHNDNGSAGSRLLSPRGAPCRSSTASRGAEGGEGQHVELGDVTLIPHMLEGILDDDQWVDDVTGLVPHCLSILKICHELAEKVVAMTLTSGRGAAGGVAGGASGAGVTTIAGAAKQITPRVDDLVRSMYPPLDVRLLEARATSLVLSVNQLVLVAKQVLNSPTKFSWTDDALRNMNHHLMVLREASLRAESEQQQDGGGLSQSQGGTGSAAHCNMGYCREEEELEDAYI